MMAVDHSAERRFRPCVGTCKRRSDDPLHRTRSPPGEGGCGSSAGTSKRRNVGRRGVIAAVEISIVRSEVVQNEPFWSLSELWPTVLDNQDEERWWRAKRVSFGKGYGHTKSLRGPRCHAGLKPPSGGPQEPTGLNLFMSALKEGMSYKHLVGDE